MAETNTHMRQKAEEEQEKVSVAAPPLQVEPDINAQPAGALPTYGGAPAPDPLPGSYPEDEDGPTKGR